MASSSAQTPVSPTGESTPTGPLSDDMTWLLGRAAYALGTRMLTTLQQQVGISVRAYNVLLAAAQAERTQTSLGDVVGLDKTTMVVTVDELEDLRLVQRRPAPGDRRARLITPTPAGLEVIAQAADIVAGTEDDVLHGLSADQRQALRYALQNLVATTLSEPISCTEVPRAPRRRQPRARA